MPRIMIFIDGTWLHCQTAHIGRAIDDPAFRPDYGRLPRALARRLSELGGFAEVDLARVHIAGSYPANVAPEDAPAAARQLDHFRALRTHHGYEVDLFEIDYGGRPLRRQDRPRTDCWIPAEKCVDVALSVRLVEMASRGAFDIAIVVCGDRDFTPALATARRLGARVAVASVRGHCAEAIRGEEALARHRDYEVIWLEDFACEFTRAAEPRVRLCADPAHAGDREVIAANPGPAHEPFVCTGCRARAAAEPSRPVAREAERAPHTAGELRRGTVRGLRSTYGFIDCPEGEYFFHASDLAGARSIDQLRSGVPVEFQVAKPPSGTERGNATEVRALV